MARLINKCLVTLFIACAVASTAMALPSNKFAKNSRLKTGKWVKIAVPTTGIYEITEDELREMGFSNPANVQVYGAGGNPISEVLDGKYPDDLQPVSVGRYNGKLCFYGLGPVKMSVADPRTTPHFARAINCYSNYGYYFLTEASSVQKVDVISAASVRGDNERPTSLGYYYHEKEMVSLSQSGKDLLGEDIVSGDATFDYNLPGIADTTLNVNVAVAVIATSYTYAYAKVLNDTVADSVAFSVDQSKIYPAESANRFYTIVSPSGLVGSSSIGQHGKLNPYITGSGTIKTAKLDYFIISYTKHNTIEEGCDNQNEMYFVSPSTSDCYVMPGASAQTIVWNVDSPSSPIQYIISPTLNSEQEIIGYDFTPRKGSTIASTEFIAFNPEMTLKKIASYEVIDNQDLHATPVPDMLIITNKEFIEQAQRIAQLHKDVDGMDVAVVDQEQVFNEFSSGAPDAMAYRLMCKMLFDRNKTKFKNLLLLGPGSFDNRGITTGKPNRILTYQSDNSFHHEGTFVSDDFFVLLEDGSGQASSLYSNKLSIGVGRYTSNNAAEASNDIDKLIKYVSLPDYGAWRNDVLITADTGDDDTHMYEAEGVSNLIETTAKTQMTQNKAYVDMFSYSVLDKTTSSEARARMAQYLQDGQYFATYVGHAGPLAFTKSKMWTSTLAQNTSYPHLPILTTACCEVARFDSDERGIADHMFHKTDGGCIAMVASPRQTINSENEQMNRGFANAVFSYSANKKMPTLGEAYMTMKNNFGYSTTGNYNKLTYVLIGDPAIKVNYPKPFFEVLTVNGDSVSAIQTAALAPMQAITVTAQVNKADGSGIDSDFNGDATLTLYDVKRLLKTVTITGRSPLDIYYPRDVLARVQGRVENGLFSGTVIIPRHTKGLYENAMIRVYAHKDNSDEMVNGSFDKMRIDQYDDSTAIVDDQAPAITTMFMNEETTFAEGAVVPANSTLYITATDDYGLNTQSASMGNCMKLLLDGGKTSYSMVRTFAVARNDGRDLSIAFPVNGLAEGNHTLTFTVFDVAGNSASRTISFVVSGARDVELNAQEMLAIDQATFSIAESDQATCPSMNIKVTDAQGHIVWNTTTSTWPVTWDLTDASGERVKPGLYKYFGNYDSGASYGGTGIGDLIVIDKKQ